MKSILKILIGTLLGLALLTSCNKENEGSILGSDVNTGLGFVQSKHDCEIDPADPQPSIRLILGRSNTTSAETVGITVTAPSESLSGKFDVPSSVTFAQGEAMAELIIPATAAALEVGVGYTFTLEIESTVENISAYKAIDVSASLRLEWEDAGTGIFTSSFFGEAWENTLQKAVGLNTYRLVSVYENNVHIIFTVNPDNSITFNKQATGFVDPSYGMISIQVSPTVASTYDGNKTYTLNAVFGIPDGRTFSGVFPETFVLD